MTKAVWPADKVERRPVAALIPYARNARVHSPVQVDQIAASIREWGWTAPILLDERDGVIAGHARLMAARKLGLVDVPCMVARGWSEAQRRAYIIADNQLTLNGAWNPDFLRIELQELQALNFDLEFTGFSLDEIAALTADRNAGLTDPDEAPEAPEEPTSRLGDVWLMGRHRLVCGDATDKGAVGRALNGAKPHLMVTDPPYGVDYDANWRNEKARTSEGMGDRAIGARAVGKSMNDDRADWRDAWAFFPGDVAYVWHADLRANRTFDSLEAAGFDIRAQIIWTKQQFAIGRGDYHFQHEPCWYAVRKGKTGHWTGDRKQTTVWAIDKPVKSETGHSAQKPVDCMKRPIGNNSKAGQAVYDPFVGSGTTIIAGEMSGRTVHAIEISPAYIDVGILRWQAFVGADAMLEETGETYAIVKARRQQAAAVAVATE